MAVPTSNSSSRPGDNPSSPYFIHSSENPSLVLVSSVLSGRKRYGDNLRIHMGEVAPIKPAAVIKPVYVEIVESKSEENQPKTLLVEELDFLIEDEVDSKKIEFIEEKIKFEASEKAVMKEEKIESETIEKVYMKEEQEEITCDMTSNFNQLPVERFVDFTMFIVLNLLSSNPVAIFGEICFFQQASLRILKLSLCRHSSSSQPTMAASSQRERRLQKAGEIPCLLYDAWVEVDDTLLEFNKVDTKGSAAARQGQYNLLEEFIAGSEDPAALLDAALMSWSLIRRGDFTAAPWHVGHHTFLTAFGEITVTLEDVAAATLLPITGDVDPCFIDLTPQETKTLTVLTDLISRFVFGGYPYNRLMSELATLAVKISCGYSVPLLGTLYHHLDTFHEDELQGVGRYTIDTFMNVPVLQSFIWEHYPKLAPEFVDKETMDKNYDSEWEFDDSRCEKYPRICSWVNKKPLFEPRIHSMFDDHGSFAFRPYIHYGYSPSVPSHILIPPISEQLAVTADSNPHENLYHAAIRRFLTAFQVDSFQDGRTFKFMGNAVMHIMIPAMIEHWEGCCVALRSFIELGPQPITPLPPNQTGNPRFVNHSTLQTYMERHFTTGVFKQKDSHWWAFGNLPYPPPSHILCHGGIEKFANHDAKRWRMEYLGSKMSLGLDEGDAELIATLLSLNKAESRKPIPSLQEPVKSVKEPAKKRKKSGGSSGPSKKKYKTLASLTKKASVAAAVLAEAMTTDIPVPSSRPTMTKFYGTRSKNKRVQESPATEVEELMLAGDAAGSVRADFDLNQIASEVDKSVEDPPLKGPESKTKGKVQDEPEVAMAEEEENLDSNPGSDLEEDDDGFEEIEGSSDEGVDGDDEDYEPLGFTVEEAEMLSQERISEPLDVDSGIGPVRGEVLPEQVIEGPLAASGDIPMTNIVDAGSGKSAAEAEASGAAVQSKESGKVPYRTLLVGKASRPSSFFHSYMGKGGTMVPVENTHFSVFSHLKPIAEKIIRAYPDFLANVGPFSAGAAFALGLLCQALEAKGFRFDVEPFQHHVFYLAKVFCGRDAYSSSEVEQNKAYTLELNKLKEELKQHEERVAVLKRTIQEAEEAHKKKLAGVLNSDCIPAFLHKRNKTAAFTFNE
ncbi:hypothetical protein CCACVL1_05508 [Corchorus capsularis]|uniref:Aminotransferase-like plant mobile domain-containing protein n=1 Tax=Corchorus capsularis TaxID=210143 RepID=A0A1R3JK63_COCAP|nr:hypothetical protein CCACVL1_05508 [Corchorus capsularis]